VCHEGQTQSKYYKKIMAENKEVDIEENLNYKLPVINPLPQ